MLIVNIFQFKFVKMVYIHFPNNLTEEELMLQAKYQKLKKKVLFCGDILKLWNKKMSFLEKSPTRIKSTKARTGETIDTQTTSRC